jgi:hypothetical protein
MEIEKILTCAEDIRSIDPRNKEYENLAVLLESIYNLNPQSIIALQNFIDRSYNN